MAGKRIRALDESLVMLDSDYTMKKIIKQSTNKVSKK
jgi:hypothetical protein